MQEMINFLSNHPILTTIAIVLCGLVFFVEYLRTKGGKFNIPPVQATQLINRNNAVVIDIRNNDAFRKGHIIDAQSLSANEIQQNPKKVEKYKSRPIIIVCGAGNESQKIAALLIKQGYNAYSLAGGMRAWIDAQMPIVKG